MKKNGKPLTRMNAKELATANVQFDKEFVIDQSREPTPEEGAQWHKAKRKPNRPKQDQVP
jgi:hypothetical protein